MNNIDRSEFFHVKEKKIEKKTNGNLNIQIFNHAFKMKMTNRRFEQYNRSDMEKKIEKKTNGNLNIQIFNIEDKYTYQKNNDMRYDGIIFFFKIIQMNNIDRSEFFHVKEKKIEKKTNGNLNIQIFNHSFKMKMTKRRFIQSSDC
jgi:TRAP-type C4-dicarboxylate transport system substrate-binding protein